MKTINFFFGMLILLIFAVGCQKEEPQILTEEATFETTYQLRSPNAPCGGNYSILWHIDEEKCNGLGYIWHINRCIVCK